MIKLLKKLTKKDMALAGLAFLLILAALCGGLTFDGSLYCCLRGKDFSKFFCQPARTGI